MAIATPIAMSHAIGELLANAKEIDLTSTPFDGQPWSALALDRGDLERDGSRHIHRTHSVWHIACIARRMLPHRLPCETPEAHRARGGTAEAAARWVLPATILGSSMGFIDGSVVNVALPAMRDDLGAELGALQWVVNGYMLALASLILLGGSAGDRYGRRRMFIAGLFSFTAASLACALAPTALWLVVARVVQGAAAALLTPTSLAIIGTAYAGEARGPAIGTWAAAGALTTALGPPLGGWLVDTVGWRSIFLINLPIGVAALALALKLPGDRGAKNAPPLDRRGSLLAVLALASLCYGLITLGEGNARIGALALAAAVPLTLLFIRSERSAAAPMMPLALFHSRDFAGANALTTLLYAALGGALFMLPFQLIGTHGYSALQAGSALLPFAVLMGLGSRWSGGLIEKLGARPPLVIGPAVTAIGLSALGVTAADSSYWTGVLPGVVVMSVGMTIAVAPLTTTVLNAVPEDSSGVASGINNAAARAGSLVAVAALGLIVGDAADVGSVLTGAYRATMYATGALAAVAAVTAALTIAPSPATRR